MRFRSSEAGYNLVILMVSLTLLNIALALALPKWSNRIRREREEELISRGFQYAEAIRIFQNRFQRLPVRIEELVEVEPRSIRRLWKDPMTENGKWVLIPPGGQGQPLTPKDPNGRDPNAPPPPEEEPGGDGDSDEEIDPDTGIGEKKGTVQVGPFSGVHSRSGKESILVFDGRTRYDEWHFTVEKIQMLIGGGGERPPNPSNVVGVDPTRIPNLSTRWLGRPIPAFMSPTQDGQMPDGSLPGQVPGQMPDPPGGSRRNRPNPRGGLR